MTRVFLLWRCGLFGGGIDSLLNQQPGIEIVGRERDVERALEQIGRLHPQVVIVGDCDPAADPLPVVARILRVQPDIRVVSLNSQDEQMAVYSGERVPVRDLGGLLAAVSGEVQTRSGERAA